MDDKKDKKIFKVGGFLQRRAVKINMPWPVDGMEEINAELDTKMEKAGISRLTLEAQYTASQITCEETQNNLDHYWNTPSRLSPSAIGKISSHLKCCVPCQESFIEFTESSG